MKCPRCNFEREENFKFCPMCGTRCTDLQNETPNMSEPRLNDEAVYENTTQTTTFVRRIPYGLTEKTYNERKTIRKVSRISSAAFILLSFVGNTADYIVFYTLLALGYTQQNALAFLDDPFFQQYFQIAASSLMFIVPFTLIFKFSGYKLSKISNFGLPKTKAWFPIVLIGIGFCAFANIAIGFASSIFEAFGINYEVDFGENPQGILGITLSVIATAIVPALVEEFACRGIVLGALRKYGDGFAVITSSILFGLIHGNFQQMPFAFMVGLILGFVTVKCNSIWPAVFIHFYNNLSSVIFDYVFLDMPVMVQNVIYTIYTVICLFIGFIGVLLLRKNTDIFKFEASSTEADDKQKFKWFFTTEMVIFLVVICILKSFQYFV